MTGVAMRFDRSGRVVATGAVAAAVLALCVSTAGSAAAAPGDITFADAVPYPTGDHPEAVATADLNGDGKLDVVTADRYENALSVFLGNGDGTLGTRARIYLGQEVTGVAVADFDKDGKADVAVSTAGPVLELRGNGDGTLGAAVSTSVTGGAEGIAAGDVNGDGRPDVVTSGPAGISVLLAAADGSLAVHAEYPSPGGYSRGVVLRDFTGDGNVDIAIGGFGSSNVYVFGGTGTGDFTGPASYPAGANPIDIAAGDFTGDGRADLATANWGDGTVAVLPGLAGGAFGAAIPRTIGSKPFGVAVADFDGDGDLDLAVSASDDSSVAVLGNGDGTFTTAATLPTGARPTEVHAADLDSDHRPDLITTNRDANGLSVLINKTEPPVPPTADLAVSMTVTPKTGLLSATLNYAVTVRNAGPGPLQSATVTATLPRGLSASPGAGCNGRGPVTCTIGSLAVGASATRTFVIPVGVLTIGSIQVTAKRTASIPTDPNASNDSATRTCNVISVMLISCR